MVNIVLAKHLHAIGLIESMSGCSPNESTFTAHGMVVDSHVEPFTLNKKTKLQVLKFMTTPWEITIFFWWANLYII